MKIQVTRKKELLEKVSRKKFVKNYHPQVQISHVIKGNPFLFWINTLQKSLSKGRALEKLTDEFFEGFG